MPAVSYVASESVIPGHTAGNTYDLDLKLANRAPQMKRRGSGHKALSGNTEYWLHRRDRTVDCQTGMLTQSQLDEYVEFLDSAGEQTFTFDPYGTVDSPHNPRPARLPINSDYRVSLASKVPHYRISFTIELL